MSTAARPGAARHGLLKQIVRLGSKRNRLSILIFHRVLAQPDPLFPNEMDASRFDARIGLLNQCFTIISLNEALHGLRTGTLPPRAACVTFDDGYADNAEIALPILQKHGVVATFFVATGFLDGGRMWNDSVIELIRRAPDAIDLRPAGFGEFGLETLAQRQGAIQSLLGALKYLPVLERQEKVDALRELLALELPADLMMSSAQVRQVHQAGMEIGGHTVSHPILASTPDAAAYQEIGDGKEALEGMIGARVRTFAYPNGKPGQDYLASHAAMVKRMGFDGAVSTSWGTSGLGGDPFQLGRFTPWERDDFRFLLRLVQNMRRSPQTV